MNNLSDKRLSKNMKYTALYWAMRFSQVEPDLFIKEYDTGSKIVIFADKQVASVDDLFDIQLNTHESFVELEWINRLFELGYSLNDLRTSNGYSFKGYTISFITWDDSFPEISTDMHIVYKSRLVSGVLEYECKIKNKDIYDRGLFEKYDEITLDKIKVVEYDNPDFEIIENRVMSYKGNDTIVVIPEGVTELESTLFWDKSNVEEIILPESLENLGGDTFYNCNNLRKITIPRNVKMMGNNPFAGCPNIEIENKSPYFILEDGALYTADKKTMIYCSIKGDETEFVIPEGVKVIGKHTFYQCDRFEKITIPASVEKLENNPFSGCSKLELINNSTSYHVIDDVIYNKFKTEVIGSLNKNKTERLELLDGIKTINRNSFWNCKGIKTIVFPSSLEDIGYNPFVGCSNIVFESHSPNYIVKDGVLYNKDLSKIVCYPVWKAVGHVKIPDSVTTLERGAFSGCDKMTSIDLHNVKIINKNGFTNCHSLKEVYISDLITYVGVWAFAYCENLTKISVNRNTIVDDNAFSNSGIDESKIEYRDYDSNYLIESENLYTLKSMQDYYAGKIDSICIDPPYNSHIDYIGYKDGDYKEGYLNFMGERIKLSYKLLSNKGFLVINIDEGEVHNLESVCKSIFGDSLVTVHRWKKKHPYFDVNRVELNPNKKQTDYEYIIICRKSNNSVLGKLHQPYLDGNQLLEFESEVPETFDCFGTTSSAKDEINELFGRRDYFSTPKPIKLLKEIIRATTDKDSIVMDFFAGSGTTGHAVCSLNKEDGGNRKFILISNSESNICKEVTKKRLDLIGANYTFLD